jgi:hypothetical protein
MPLTLPVATHRRCSPALPLPPLVQAEVTAARNELAAVQKRLNGAVARRNVVESECRDLKDKVQVRGAPAIGSTLAGMADAWQRSGSGDTARTRTAVPSWDVRHETPRVSLPLNAYSAALVRSQMLLEKTDNDDKLIDALKTELRKSSMRKPTGAAPGAGAPRASANAAVTAAETAALEERVREKEAQIQRQEKIILALQSQVRSTRQRKRSGATAACPRGHVAATPPLAGRYGHMLYVS